MALLTETNQQYYEGSNLGSYQFITLTNVINNFMLSYTGPDKIVGDTKRTEVLFHAQRALQELSYDTLKSVKTQEVEVSPSLSIPLPHDYVNYVKISWVDENGVEHRVMPTRQTSTPTPILQDSNFNYIFDNNGDLVLAAASETEQKYQAATSGQAVTTADLTDILAKSEDEYKIHYGTRYGLNPETTNRNGSFVINDNNGTISFSGDFNGRLIIIKYISDGLATEAEMKVHKFAEDAIYKFIAHSIISTKNNIPEYQVRRYQKDKAAAIRKAKLRLSNLKIEELNQIMKGKSKQIKH
jgi:hypothetical protein